MSQKLSCMKNNDPKPVLGNWLRGQIWLITCVSTVSKVKMIFMSVMVDKNSE